MSVNNLSNKVTYLGDDITFVFPYNFKIFLDEDLIAEKTVIASGIVTELILNVDFTVSGAGEEAGGNVTCIDIPATGTKLTIRRVLPLTQLVELADNEGTPAATYEEVFDRAIMICQQLAEEIDRAIKQSVTSVTPINIPALIAGRFLHANSATALDWSALTTTDYAGNIDRGIDINKSATPSLGDIYVATDSGKYYVCFTVGVWTNIYTIAGGATRGTFVNADLAAGILTIPHALGLSAPYPLLLKIYKNTGEPIEADITGGANSHTVDLNPWGVIAGTWGYEYI